MIGLYHPGTSVLHRLSAGWKMLAMLAGVVAVTLARHPWQLGVAALVVVALAAVSRIPARVLLAQLWPMRWFLVVLAVFQVVLADWQRALMVCGALLIAVALAALFTLTTRVTAVLDLVRRLLGPFRRFGVDPDRIGLLLALTIRCVPLLVTIVGQVMQARKARGLGFSLVAIVTPTVVRALRAADGIGDALVARGVDD